MDDLDIRINNLLKLCQEAKKELKEVGELIEERRQIRIDFEKKAQELEDKLNV